MPIHGKPWCDKHNETKQVDRFYIGSMRHERHYCVACDHEKQSRDKALADHYAKLKEHEIITQLITTAGITPRFRSKTLANWTATTDQQKKIKRIAEDVAHDPKNRSGLILLGRPGTGKNHLACGIADALIRSHHMTALMTTALKMVRSIKESWKRNDQTESQIIRSFRSPDLLIIDEIGVQFGSDTERLYLTEIINERYEWLQPTILISNWTIHELTKLLGARVIDRFKENGHVLVFDWESYRGRK